MLQPIGVREFDEDVYRVLLMNPSRTTAELAATLRVSTAKARAGLVRLEEIGLIRRLPGNRFAPAAPRPVLEALLHQRQADVQRELDGLRGTIETLAGDYQSAAIETDPGALIEIVPPSERSTQRALELWNSLTEELLAFDKPPQRLGPIDEVELERPLLERGVRIRGIYQRDLLDQPGRPDRIRALAELGEESRIHPRLPIKLYIYDRRVAMVTLTTDARGGRAIIHESGLLDALIALFEAYWERAQPVAWVDDLKRSSDDPAGLDRDERTILGLLATGMKDDAIARQLGSSRRTVTRRVERLLKRLDATSRFQAGAQAVRRGLLP